ncbi:Uncharacterized conserved protein YdeI, YjbR/CyaY-like superfamily, DUF1801 family [Muriicola jejuensis]|uniref:YdhG-like domain-containing protein n=1 Tax=Muriicola jejuensis TaxID=504488 RepID=A0A6P0UE10_9FLAO|nr:YdeI/OmpD-associated family protein [Muriicola jejuensis]NER10720.1 hypothetical protein [Muriicola jejuensis]SMP16590.1 Uncharacterized conserved protein YdeI, YjbR/CyaY-like superfamily, DUF1801 family [Muriicola jejuensis]
MSQPKVDAYYQRETPFRAGLSVLRELALKTGLEETYKWNSPVYTLDGKNVFGINAFKTHFGIWFFNGCYLKDPKNVLENAQEGKTKAMRHWKFSSAEEIEAKSVLAYMIEAVDNQKEGKVWTPEPKKSTVIPGLLRKALKAEPALENAFTNMSAYKQREFCEYIDTAKQEETKLKRLEKIIPMIRAGVSMNDQYRKS